nr:hypothetical protein [Tanacetum cinerariifolium]
VNTPRSDKDRLEFMELTIFLLPSDEKVGFEVSAVDLQVSTVRLILLLFATAKPKNFSDDFLLITLGAMFEKPNIHAQICKNQRSVHGQVKVKSWKLLESCGVQIITFTTTQLILLVERRYPLTRFTLNQMLNNVRLEVEEENEVSLELLSYGVDAAMDFKKKTCQVFNAAGERLSAVKPR